MSTRINIIRKILYIPLDFWIDHAIKEKKEWMEEKRRKRILFKDYNITLNEIESYLKENTELIKAWLNFSENKRSGSYYFKYENSLYTAGKIGFLFMPSKIYTSKAQPELPCALYICKELKLKLCK